MNKDKKLTEPEKLISQIRYLVLQDHLSAAERLQLIEKVLLNN